MKKSLDKVAQRIFATFAGLSLLVFSISTITNNPVQAEGPERVAETGKYMMHQNSIVKPNGDWFWHILVWNTETGKSKLYFFKRGDGELKKTSFQLPTSPLY